MNRRLSPTTNLETLKKEAKRWLKSLRSGDRDARARLVRINAHAPAEPSLREIQHALAREFGLPGWTALKEALSLRDQDPAAPAVAKALDPASAEELSNTFLTYACADPLLARGPAEHARRSQAALRMLERHPEIAKANLHTAIVCGNLEEVKRRLSERSEAATEPGGPLRHRQLAERQKLWTPLLRLCYGRLPLRAAAEQALAIAEILLEHGANPNDFFEVGSHPCRYTALCGLAGEGEDGAPPHPRRDELTRLLLERGAEPYDIQLLYNTHFEGDILWYLRLMHESSLKVGRQADWSDPAWSMIDMGGLGHGARFLLGIAVANNQLRVAKWCLDHGADPNAAPSSHPGASKESLLHEARRRGFMEMAALLAAHGAVAPIASAVDELDQFALLCLTANQEEIRELVARHPEYLRSHKALWLAAERDRIDVVAMLLELGTPIEIEDETKQRAIHVAAGHDSFQVTRLLIKRGAELECVESNWNSTPLGQAIYGNRQAMIKLLGPYSTDPFSLVSIGHIDRLRELLQSTPDLAHRSIDDWTLLMALPDDPVRAVEMVELLLAKGAAPTVRNRAGKTASEIAQERGLYDAADRLRAQDRPPN